ncbi:hypothetical protein T4D_16548 [Trichinella pseudospiralis]|uniref:Uncharacterized protein n=1 Tax=Trichinella pseudospiralis TaxID=6337 RepID=A0A0V1G1K9_TRIPS|nr:hypothetical protein T4D_16548 [Trichinella pseudospiralis]
MAGWFRLVNTCSSTEQLANGDHSCLIVDVTSRAKNIIAHAKIVCKTKNKEQISDKMTRHYGAVHVAVVFVVVGRDVGLANVERQRRRYGVVKLVPKHRVGPE